jgi:hypothetical protein
LFVIHFIKAVSTRDLRLASGGPGESCLNGIFGVRGKRFVTIGGENLPWAPVRVGECIGWLVSLISRMDSLSKGLGLFWDGETGQKDLISSMIRSRYGRGGSKARKGGRWLAGPDARPVLVRLLRVVIRKVPRALPIVARIAARRIENTVVGWRPSGRRVLTLSGVSRRGQCRGLKGVRRTELGSRSRPRAEPTRRSWSRWLTRAAFALQRHWRS